MLKVLGAFLLIFWLLSLIVQATGVGILFGSSALVLFGIDLMLSRAYRDTRPTRAREPIL